MEMFVLLSIFFSFVLGILYVLAVEAMGVAFLIRWLKRKNKKQERKLVDDSLNSSASAIDLDPSVFYNKEGFVWIFESSKVPEGWPFDKVAKEQKPKNETLEVTPVRKHAKIMDYLLVLTDPDGSQSKIPLSTCKIEAVSASASPKRKWAKRFPVKVEGKESEIYKGCKIVFIYLETSWEKESWCEALRLASIDDKEKNNWVSKLRLEFFDYVNTLKKEYPSFMKSAMGISADHVDRSLITDGSSSKVRQFLKKLTKKASKRDIEVKTSSNSMSSGGVARKRTVKSYSFGDSAFPPEWEKLVPAAKPNNSKVNKLLSSKSFVATGNEGQSSTICDKDPDEKMVSDEGTLCWNLLISRFFFDAKNNMEIKNALQSRIQRLVSNIPKSSYIGEITCTSADTGNVPPQIHGMRVLASNMNEVWAFEIDIEYAGGAVLGVETRVEVGELKAQEEEEKLKDESSPMGEVTTDLLEGIEYYGKELNISKDAAGDMELKHERDGKSSKTVTRASSQVSRWKSMVHAVAKQVSQLPLSLGIKLTSLRGTVRLFIKPPPSDRIWFAFTTMPEVELSLDSFVGEHKVTSGHLAVYLISRFKTAIRDTLVLPNSESVYIPWMLGERDDWVPRKVAPFMWVRRNSVAETTPNQEVPGSRLGDVVSEVVNSTNKQEAQVPQQGNEVPNASQDVKPEDSVKDGCKPPIPPSISSDRLSDISSVASLNTHKPLEKTSSMSSCGTVESQVTSRSVSLGSEASRSVENDDTRPQKAGAKARMLGFRKRVGEKLEEKKRSLGEKGKIIVEKIRESKPNN